MIMVRIDKKILFSEAYVRRNEIYAGDCCKLLRDMEAGAVDLVFADPPFNIGKTYGHNDDKKEPLTYRKWCRNWISECHRVLKRDGAIWIAINDENVWHIYQSLTECGFQFRNWITWYYSFGQNQRKKFSRCHTHILYFSMHKRNLTFNADPVRVPSARLLKYKDKRANPLGKVPDDVWNYDRVCGTYKERNSAGHECQMPEKLMQRIILSTSNPGELVLDPFGGTGTTPAVALKNGRDYMAFDNVPEYVAEMRERMREIIEHD